MVKSIMKPWCGSKRAHLSSWLTFHVDLISQVAFGRRLLDDSRRLQQKYERPGASVHDRDLGAGHVDMQIVDSQSGKRRHQVLDGRDSHSRYFRAWKTSACRHITGVGGDRYRLRQIGAMENNTGIGRRGRSIISTRTPVVQSHPGRFVLFLACVVLSMKAPGATGRVVRKRNGSRVYVMLPHPPAMTAP
jgi:hypothetical protein